MGRRSLINLLILPVYAKDAAINDSQTEEELTENPLALVKTLHVYIIFGPGCALDVMTLETITTIYMEEEVFLYAMNGPII